MALLSVVMRDFKAHLGVRGLWLGYRDRRAMQSAPLTVRPQIAKSTE